MEVIRFAVMHVLPPVAAFAGWNAIRQGRRLMLGAVFLGTAAAWCGVVLDEQCVALIGVALMAPPAGVMLWALRSSSS